jgi:galactitol-specific phosphotransferase system IIC component
MEVDGSETFDSFDMVLHLLSINMWQEVVKVIGPFKFFLKAFDSPQVHKYVGLNVGSPFQILMGCGNAIQLVAKYDVKEVITLLMTNFDHLNPTIQAMSIVPNDGLDGVVIEIEEENTNFLVFEHP